MDKSKRIGQFLKSSVVGGEHYNTYVPQKLPTETAQAIIKLFNKDRTMIEKSGRSTATILTLHTYLQRNPISNTTKMKKTCDLVLPSIMRALKTLEELGIVKEITGKERHKVFVYNEYLDILSKGTEPLKY